MELAQLTAESRKAAGSRAAARLRKEGKLPGIVYGHKEEPQAVALSLHALELALQHGAHLLELNLDGVTQQVLIKEVQYDHLGTTPVHVDLARVSLDERVNVKVSVELRGTAKGIKEGGILDLTLADIEVQCAVASIPETLRVDVSELGIGQSLHVRDLKLPDGVEAMDAPELVVCTVRMPITAEAVEAAEEGEGTAAPEVIGRKEKEEAAEE
ncbi:MAG: 50S ribosomal protein L25 [Phycisphaerae bacterium]|nr:50S ribosomal protein L25 [Phycisphaerae bacterium]